MPSQWHAQASVLLYAAGIHLKDALGQHQNLALSILQGRHLYINVLFVPKPLFRGYLLFYCPLFTGRFTADTSAYPYNIPSVPLFSEIEYHISRGSTFFTGAGAAGESVLRRRAKGYRILRKRAERI